MAKSWQLQEAKNQLSEVIQLAVDKGPQVVTRHGVETAVILSIADYRKLNTPTNLVDFFRRSPLVGLDLDFTRTADYPREVKL